MTEKEQLWYLIRGLMEGTYEIETFCSEFTRIYNLETDYEKLSRDENTRFKELRNMTARFSDDEEELKIPNVYFSEEKIRSKVAEIYNYRL